MKGILIFLTCIFTFNILHSQDIANLQGENSSKTKITEHGTFTLVKENKWFINISGNIGIATSRNHSSNSYSHLTHLNLDGGYFISEHFAFFAGLGSGNNYDLDPFSTDKLEINCFDLGYRIYPAKTFFINGGYKAMNTTTKKLRFYAIGIGGTFPINSWIAFEPTMNFLLSNSSRISNLFNFGLGFAFFL